MPRPPLHHEVYVTGCYTLYNEDLAIVKFSPPVDMADFKKLAEGLHTFFSMRSIRFTLLKSTPAPLVMLMSDFRVL